MIYAGEGSDDLPMVMAEVKVALGAAATTLTQHPSDGSPPEILYHDNAAVATLDLAKMMESGTRQAHAFGTFGWTRSSSSGAIWDVLSFSVNAVPGHAPLLINALYPVDSRDCRASAEQAFLSLCPFATGYFRLWQSNRVHARQSSALEEALSHSKTGVILINRANQITFANAAGQGLLTEGKSIRRNSDDSLSAVKMAESLRLQVALAHVVEAKQRAANRTAPIMSLRRSNGEALILSVLPTSQVGTEPNDVGAIVYIHDPFINTDRLMLPLCRLFGLSPTETRLASLLVAGTPLPECAIIMRVAQQTARGYLKQLFQKTSTRRQVDLVRLMLTSLIHVDPSIEVEAI